MARVSTYLNFNNKTEEAFHFYESVFNTKINFLQRFSETPPQPGQEKMTKADLNGIMHVSLPIVGEHMLLGTDAPESMGFKLVSGNNVSISLEPDSKEQGQQIFNSLAKDGKVTMPFEHMFWGAYFGSCIDKYGVQWMINFPDKK